MKNRDQPTVPATVEVESTHRSFCGDKELSRKKENIECNGLSKVESLARDIFIAELSREEMDAKHAQNYSAWAIKVANIFYNEFEKGENQA